MFNDISLSQMLMQYVCLLFALSVHEAAHAAMANRCGDPSARLLGRMTLNPVKHADPVGTVIMPLLMMFTGIPYLFGWAKPVPFNPRNLNDMNRDPVFIALAGPGSNLAIALTAALLLRVVATLSGVAPDLQIWYPLVMVLMYMVAINLVLLLFNMIPVPPLDGHHVLGYFLPPSGQRALEQIGPFGILIAILLVSQVGILDVPFRALNGALHFLAFRGTPLDVTGA